MLFFVEINGFLVILTNSFHTFFEVEFKKLFGCLFKRQAPGRAAGGRKGGYGRSS